MGKPQICVMTAAVKPSILVQVIALARADLAHSSLELNQRLVSLVVHKKGFGSKNCLLPHFDSKKDWVNGNYDVS